MQRLLLFFPLVLILACGQTSQEEMDRNNSTNNSTNNSATANGTNAPSLAPPTDDAGPESSVSGELPFSFLTREDFSILGDCSVLLSPEDFPDRYVLGFADPEGEALGSFDGTTRKLPFVSKGENGAGNLTYTHANEEYEAVTRLDGEGAGMLGVVTIRRISDSRSVTFRVIGNRDC